MDDIEITDFYPGKQDSNTNRQGGEKETGFPSPARDHLEKSLSLDEYVIRRPAATFFVRVKGSGMTHAGIHENDLLVIDRSLKPKKNNIVVVLLDGEYKIRRIVVHNGRTYLSMDSDAHNDMTEITSELEYAVWGVVTHTIHQYI